MSLTAEYPWLAAPLNKLEQLRTSDRLPHAILLEGAEGVGKKALGRFFAQTLLCRAEGHKPCGECKDCLLFSQQTHPDFYWVEPEEAGKQIRIQQIRELSDFIGTHAQQGGYRIIVVTPAEAMNQAASNALLKGLEEPGENTLFLLLSDRPGQLLPTIRSRCQRLAVAAPSTEDATQWLQQQGSKEAELCLSLAGGAPMIARQLAEGEQLQQRQQLFDSLKQTAGGKVSVPQAAQGWIKSDLLQLLQWLASLVNDVGRYQQLKNLSHCHNQDAEKLIIRAAERVETKALFAFADKIQEYRQLLLAKHNPNPQLLCEDLLICWLSLIHNTGAKT